MTRHAPTPALETPAELERATTANRDSAVSSEAPAGDPETVTPRVLVSRADALEMLATLREQAALRCPIPHPEGVARAIAFADLILADAQDIA